MQTDKQQPVKYSFAVIEVSASRPVEVGPNCNGWTAINVGLSVGSVNGIPLNPGLPGTNNGESFAIGGNQGEIYSGRIDVAFPAGGGLILIIQKYYL